MYAGAVALPADLAIWEDHAAFVVDGAVCSVSALSILVVSEAKLFQTLLLGDQELSLLFPNVSLFDLLEFTPEIVHRLTEAPSSFAFGLLLLRLAFALSSLGFIILLIVSCPGPHVRGPQHEGCEV